MGYYLKSGTLALLLDGWFEVEDQFLWTFHDITENNKILNDSDKMIVFTNSKEL